MLRVLFTGLGFIGKQHLRILRELDESFDIHAYRSGKSDREAPPDVTVHYDLQTALSEQPDIAFITNPTSMHVETALACVRHGCHLFMEKPLSHTLDGVDQLIEAAEENSVITYMGCPLRFHPVLRRIDEKLSNGALGDVFSFRGYIGSYLPDWRQGEDYRESYSAHPDMGGGVELDLIHEIDYAYWLFGEVSEVMAWTGRVSDLEIESNDLAEIILEMETGAVGELHLDYYRPEKRRTLEVVCQQGVMSADLDDASVEISLPDSTQTEQFDFEFDDMLRDQLVMYLSKVRNGIPCDNDLQEGKRVLEIALEARHG